MKPDSLAFKVVGYFFVNPEEEHSHATISERWGVECTAKHLHAAVRDGLLSVREEDDRDANPERIYSAGPALLAAMTL
jgi:hypothetical protein